MAISQITMSNFIYCITVFILLEHCQNKIIKDNLIIKFGNYSYGIYLSHVLVLMVIKKIINSLNFNYFYDIISTYIITITIVYFINWFYYEKIKKVNYARNNRKT